MGVVYENRHGRKPGRGLRPWWLIPKLVGVAMYLGGLIAAWVLIQLGQPASHAGWGVFIEQVGIVYRWVMVPGAVIASVFGVVLFLEHPRVFVRARWFQAKVVVVVVGNIVLHVLARSAMIRIRETLAGGVIPHADVRWLGHLTLAAVAMTICIVVLGRQKPRLGQNWAKAYPSRRPSEPATGPEIVRTKVPASVSAHASTKDES